MKILDSRENVIQNAITFVNGLSKDDSIYIIGANKFGLSTANFLHSKGFSILGFIDDFNSEIFFSGYLIFKSQNLLNNDVVVNCVVEGRTIDIDNFIKSFEIKSLIDYFSLQSAFKNDLIEIDFLENTFNIKNRVEDYSKIYNLLNDKQSKNEFKSITNFRFNRDIKYLSDFKFRLKEQYFEDFFDMSQVNSFIDGGAFDGSTTVEFIKKKSTFENILLFEPNYSFYKLLLNKFSDTEKIKIFNKGLWDVEKVLFFNSNLGSASKIDEKGADKIETINLDVFLDYKIDFIKLDVEGAEKQALLGSKALIKKWRPILAVCVYHNQDDFVDIPKIILNINPNYKIYLRHYTQGVFETVMYFVP